MNIILLRESIKYSAVFAFSRSGGPGGQNVNKVNTKVEARVVLSELLGLSEPELHRVRSMLANRLLDGDVLQVVSSEERSQATNRERALSRIEALIIAAARIPKHRKATKPTRSSIEKRLQSKHGLSKVKRIRTNKPNSDD